MAGLVGQTLDHYELVEQIGQGGMATVFRGIDTRTQEEVAIKVLSPTITGDRRFVKRFRREAEIVKQRLRHPHIVPVIAYGQTNSYIYLVMPFIRGETLSERLVRKGLTEREAGLYIEQVASALQFAHRNGVIHRDIKPANVIITESGEAMLSDFGLAREVEGSGTLTGSMLMGTPAFVSPEQAKGEKLDAKSDQYSLGVILYMISTGRLPFDSESPMTLVLMHIQNPVPPPRKYNPNLQSAVERVILKSLAKDPAERFPTIANMAKAYKAALAGDPVEWVKAPTEVLPRPQSQIGTAAPAPRRAIPRWVVPAAIVPVAIVLGVLAFNSGAEEDRPSIGPVATLPPTQTPTPGPAATPTETQIPPTPTDAGGAGGSPICARLSLLRFRREGDTVSWLLSNNSDTTVHIVGIYPPLPIDNPLTRVTIGAQNLWELDPGSTPAPDEEIQILLDQLPALDSQELPLVELEYDNVLLGTGYHFEIIFDNGCTIATEW